MTDKVISTLSIAKEFKDLERGWVAAYMHGNAELFERVWNNGFIFTFPFAQFSDKEQALADIKSGNLAFESFATKGTTVEVEGNTAVMAGHFVMRARYKGRDISGEYSYTNLLEKLEKCWQIVATHAARVD